MSITSNYDIRSNVTSIEDAELIFLGECHDTEAHEKSNAKIIDSLFKPGDIVFVEEDENVTKQTLEGSQIKFVQSSITIKGWDTKNLINDILIPSMKNWIKPMAISGIIAAVLCQPIIGSSYHLDKILYCVFALFNTFNLMTLMANEAVRSIVPRNRQMYRILDENPVQKGNRRYVVAGLGHFVETEVNKEKGLDTSTQMRDLDNFLRDKKFAVLIPKERKVLMKEIKVLNFG